MELTERELETIVHLKIAGIDTPESVIAFCKRKLTLPRRTKNNRHKARIITRTHSRKHYQDIIKFLG